jgi:ABC-type glutathione transport system ATPase component
VLKQPEPGQQCDHCGKRMELVLVCMRGEAFTPVLQVRNMTKEYTTRSGRPFLAANNVSLDVPANSITALLGPSGSGGSVSAGCRCNAPTSHVAGPVRDYDSGRSACRMQHNAHPTSCHIVVHRQDDSAAAYSGTGGNHRWQRDVWRCGLRIMLLQTA